MSEPLKKGDVIYRACIGGWQTPYVQVESTVIVRAGPRLAFLKDHLHSFGYASTVSQGARIARTREEALAHLRDDLREAVESGVNALAEAQRRLQLAEEAR